MAAKKKAVDIDNSTIAKRTGYTDTLQKIQMEGFCPFCEKNLAKHHAKPILIQGAHWLVTKNNWPYKGSRHHFLLISRTHVEKIEELTAVMWTELQKHIQTLTRQYKCKGGTLMLRSGDTTITGATVTHLHAHFIVGAPRTDGSTEIRAVIGFEKK